MLGLADGLAFVIAFHTAADFLVPFLFCVALQCPYVALWFNWSGVAEWLPWAPGVFTTALVGAAVGLALGVCAASAVTEWRLEPDAAQLSSRGPRPLSTPDQPPEVAEAARSTGSRAARAARSVETKHPSGRPEMFFVLQRGSS